MKEKAVKFFSDYKYSLIIFAVLSVQAIINLTPMNRVGEFLHVYYLVDFSMGITSRLLVGSIVNLLTDNPDADWVNRFVIITVFVSLFFVSILAGKVVSGVKKELRPHALVFALFLVSGPFTFAPFTRYIGFLDVFMFLVALAAVAFLNNRVLQWFVPLLCAVGVFIHQGFVLSFFWLVILSSFYMTFTHERKAEKKAVFVLSAAASVASVLFCTLYGAKTVTLPFEKMCEIVERRGGCEFSEEALANLGFYFYNKAPTETQLSPDQFSDLSLWGIVRELLDYTNNIYLTSFRGLISIMSIAVLVFVIFWIIWINCVKNAETKSRKFMYVCFMLATLIVPFYCLIAVDYVRWIQAGLITQFGIAFLMFCKKDEPFEKTIIQIGNFFKDKKMFLVIIYLVYALAVQRNISG